MWEQALRNKGLTQPKIVALTKLTNSRNICKLNVNRTIVKSIYMNAMRS